MNFRFFSLGSVILSMIIGACTMFFINLINNPSVTTGFLTITILFTIILLSLFIMLILQDFQIKLEKEKEETHEPS